MAFHPFIHFERIAQTLFELPEGCANRSKDQSVVTS